MDERMDEHVAAFEVAAQLLVAIVDQVPDSAWDEPGLGTWNVRELVAHARRGLTTVEDYLVNPVEPVSDFAAYAAPEAVAARAAAGVAALGDDPRATVRATSERVTALIASTPLDHPVGTPAGERALGDYLPSRTAELTLHSIDLAEALGVDVDVPPLALRETLACLAGMAVQRGDGSLVARALSGRGVLPRSFSVY